MLSPTEPLRLVQVGAGVMGRAWLRVIGQSTGCPARRPSRPRPRHRPAAAADAGFTDVAVAATLEELLDRVEADAVINVTSRGPTPRSAPWRCCAGCRAVREAAGGDGAAAPVHGRGRRGSAASC